MSPQPKQDVIDLALKIADSAARADVECYCGAVAGVDGSCWYDTEKVEFIKEPGDAVFLGESIRYLELRGLLLRHLDDPTLVSFPREGRVVMGEQSVSYDGIAPGVTEPLLKRKKFRVADLFCGAGGCTSGAEKAILDLCERYGWMPDWDFVVVNHWDIALKTHFENHPKFRHINADLEHLKPWDAVPGGVLDLLIAAPTCTFHSRARGGKPVYDQQRMDPWHVVRWCTDLRVHRLMVENVPEFMDWGPCNAQTGKPIKSRKGEYFRAWCAALESCGFRIDWKVLVCADNGDATTRTRFFLIGRSDGKPLRWPEPSHIKGGSTDLLGTRKPWKAAAEIIDWSIKGKSIFTRKKPLAQNTLRRILAGAERYHWPAPYLEALRALLAGQAPVLDISAAQAAPFLIRLRGTHPSQLDSSAQSVGAPLPGLTAGGGHIGLVMATGSYGLAHPADRPLPTITTGGNGKGNARPQLIEPIIFRSNQGHGRTREMFSAGAPLPTIICSESLAVATPLISPYYGSGSGETCKGADQPLDSITTKGRFGVATPVMIRTDQTSGSHDQAARGVGEPLHTVVSKANAGLAQPFLVPNFGEAPGQEPRTHSIDDPLPTATASGHIQLAEPAVEGYRIDILYRMLHYTELGRATFPEGYRFAGTATQITKQIGNAVPWRTARALAYALLEAA